MRKGLGKTKCKDFTHEGYYKNDLMHGVGVMETPGEKKKFLGNFVYGEPNGNATNFFENDKDHCV